MIITRLSQAGAGVGSRVGANPGQYPCSASFIITTNTNNICKHSHFNITIIIKIVIICTFVQVLFESEEPHFYTGDLSDSAALLVRILKKMMMMMMKTTMKMTMVLIPRSGWVSLSPLGLAMAVVLGITVAVGLAMSLGTSEHVNAAPVFLLQINLFFEMNLVFCVLVPNSLKIHLIWESESC